LHELDQPRFPPACGLIGAANRVNRRLSTLG